MNEELRALLPQMADYWAETQVYVPYLMHGARPGIRSAAFSTDEHGFRRTLRRGAPVELAAFCRLPREARPSALVGNSTAFGVGATSDATALASRLNDSDERIFFNFAGRTFNQVQELIAFQLFAPAFVDTAVVMTGINLLDMSYRFASDAHVDLPPFHVERLFWSRLERDHDDSVGAWLRRGWRRLRGRPAGDGFVDGDLATALKRGLEDPALLVADPANAGRALAHFRRTLEMWRGLVPTRIGRLLFVLQPVPDWFGRPLSPRESRLLALSEAHRPPAWRTVGNAVAAQAAGFRRGMLDAAGELGIEMLDLNQAPQLVATEWVFIDRYHLSDDAQAAVARSIVEGLAAGPRPGSAE